MANDELSDRGIPGSVSGGHDRAAGAGAMTIESLEIMQRQARKSDVPASELGVAQASLLVLSQIATLLAEIAIELKQERMKE